MSEKELILRCQCGTEILCIDPLDEDFDYEYILSFKTSPIKENIWNKIKSVWGFIKGDPNYEIVLSKEQMDILSNWVKEMGSSRYGKDK